MLPHGATRVSVANPAGAEIYRGAANTLSNTDTVPASVTSSVDSDVAVKSIQKGNMTAHP